MTASLATWFRGEGQAASTVETARVEAAARVTPNRTLPIVQPPQTGLEFSTSPTAQEISRARVFEEPLVPIGGEPSVEENAALAAALLGYTKRSGPDDFSSVTAFLARHPTSPWRAALLTDLGLDYYNTAYYSRALEAWEAAWVLGQKATDAKGKFLADRAACELAGMYSRLGRMSDLEALLKSVEKRTFLGGASERINLAREALWIMQNRPEVSFRCGPLALQSILRSDQRLFTSCPTNAMMEIFNSASTQQGFSLTQVAELSRKIGLNFQMAFLGTFARSSTTLSPSDEERDGVRGAFVVPSVVHWKAGHYAALVRREGDRYLVQDPTFGNEVWATRQALEAEASGYFLIPAGDLPHGWRRVDAKEGETVWGKGVTSGSDPNQYTCSNEQTSSCTGSGCGMPVATVHLMLANLQIRDTPVGYTPPVGPPVYFTVRYNQRDIFQPVGSIDRLLGPKWTHNWSEHIQSATATYLVGGGGARVFSGFNAGTQTYAPNQYDQTILKRTTANTFELTYPDGSKKSFGPVSDNLGYVLSQVMDSAGNAVTLTYDGDARLVAITDAIGQVTTISYEHTNNPALITKVTDPFGRFATFEYHSLAVPTGNCPTDTNRVDYSYHDLLVKITDVLGLESRFSYQGVADQPCLHPPDEPPLLYNDIITRMQTPYGVTSFTLSGGPPTTNNTRVVQIFYPDGSSERVEYNQSDRLGIPASEPQALLPVGMSVIANSFLYGRNTYYWSRTAMASSGGAYSKAKVYHWLHTENLAVTSGVLESVKEPLENRVWYNYPGQLSFFIGASSRPTGIGRMLEDGQTQLYTYAHNQFGHVTNSVDPVGRTFSYLYASNGIDLQEVRQTRAGNNELLARMTYNAQHRPLTAVDAAGQTNTFTYNARGQRLTATNPKGETTTFTYGVDGQLQRVDGPLPGNSDTILFNHDALYRIRAITDSSGYRIEIEYDDMDRLTRITYPDSTFAQFTYDRLDLVTFRDRAGRQTFYEIDNMRQVRKQTDPLGRVTRFEWCRCGDIKSLTDPMGRTTSWITDVQGRVTAKRYGDGSQVSYIYEGASSRLKHIIDEKEQVTLFDWNRDDTLNSLGFATEVRFAYDPNYQRVTSMTDGTGITRYSYNPILATPALGAGALASVDGPLPNDMITYGYDELGRTVSRAINGVRVAMNYDAAGRAVGETNALGTFAFTYDGSSRRLASLTFPNAQIHERSYGGILQDLALRRITHRIASIPVSEFLYSHDTAASRIASWSQQAGAQPPDRHTFGYDAVNQLLSATVTNGGGLVNTFAYSYDLAGNRLTESVGGSNYTATYNALNQIHTTSTPVATRTNEWDAEDRLVAVNVGNQRTEFTYDGLSRRVAIRHLVNGSEVSFRQFVWCDGEICEERNVAGAVTKRFFPQGMKVETGSNAGNYFYTRDHLGSVREITDAAGSVRARYSYDPYGRRTKLSGDMEADFGFAGMFWSAEVDLSLTQFRAYDAELGRWLSRDPLSGVELKEGPNLYAYVVNDPVNRIDPLGLISSLNACFQSPATVALCINAGIITVQQAGERGMRVAQNVGSRCAQAISTIPQRIAELVATHPEIKDEIEIFRNHSRTPARLDSAITGWLTGMIRWDRNFFETAELLALELGIEFEQAWAMLSQKLGDDPNKWMPR